MGWHLQVEGAAQGNKREGHEEKVSKRSPRSLQYFIFCEFKLYPCVDGTVALQSVRLPEPIVVHDGWSGVAGGLQQKTAPPTCVH
jgi:hypothetical protein